MMRGAIRSCTASRWGGGLRAMGTGRDLLSSPAGSLFFDRPFEVARPEVEKSFFGRLVLRVAGYYGADSRRRRGANNLYDAVTEQAESEKFYEIMQLQKSAFAAVHNVLGLHMWLLIKRLDREATKDAKKLTQIVYDQFLHDVDMRVHKAGVTVEPPCKDGREELCSCGQVKVSQRLEDLERKFYGRCLAYDKALKNEVDESLAAALLRNVYEGEKEKIFASRLLEQ